MCGIVGQWNLEAPIDEGAFTAMRDTLVHRGPEDAGNYFDLDRRLALGHRRLSFFDLGPGGRQPICNEDESLWLTFNGEIYNYIELRKELQAMGHQFRSQTDSEVLLHGYEAWGPAMLQRVKGMFAFAIWDGKARSLFLARDRFGIKPLYYAKADFGFVFGSELKALRACPQLRTRPDISAVWDYLNYRYVPSPRTIWEGVRKLPPAHYLLLDRQHKLQIVEYWRPVPGDNKPPVAEAREKVRALVQDSVREHIRSDVQVGSFLSGGYDSSAIVAFLHSLAETTDTFSIGFKDWVKSEHHAAAIVAETFGMTHHAEVLDSAALDLLPKLAHYYDEPLADISTLPTYLVSGLARRHVKAVLSGEGADEMFCGYHWQASFYNAWLRRSRWQRLQERLGRRSPPDVLGYYAESMAMGRFDTAELRRALAPEHAPPEDHDVDWFYAAHLQQDTDPLKAIQYLDVKAFMGELVLTKVDRASMAHSLEARVPFLDHELFEYVYGLAPSVYYDPKQQKSLLYGILKGSVPPAILDRPKQGFVGPDRYYREPALFAKTLKESRLTRDGIIRASYVDELLQKEAQWRLWKLMVLAQWWDHWV